MKSKLILLVVLIFILLVLGRNVKTENKQVSPAETFVTATPTQTVSPTPTETPTPTFNPTNTPTLTPTPTIKPKHPCNDCKDKKCKDINCFGFPQ